MPSVHPKLADRAPPGKRPRSALGHIDDVRLVATLKFGTYSPRELRQAFAQSLRESIMRATLDGRIENHIAEELWRVIPAPERA